LIAFAPHGQVISQLELYAVDVQTLHEERATVVERLARAYRDVDRVLHERDTLRTRLEREFQLAEILRAERDALLLAGTVGRRRSMQRDARGRLNCVLVAGVAVAVGFAVGAAPLFS
jgi:hypothetical protein